MDVGSTIKISVWIITAVCVAAGALLGLLRGRNRAALRAVLVALSALAAFLLKGTFAGIMMNFKIDGQTLEQTIAEGAAGTDMPQSAAALVTSLTETVLGVFAFISLFAVTLVITWLIFFPILKIFVKKEGKKSALFGGAVGLLQGVFAAFVICAPITGTVLQIERVSNLSVGGQKVSETANLPDVSGYTTSATCKVYDSTGKWLFDALTTYKVQNGSSVTLEDTVGAAEAGTKVVEEMGKIQESLAQIVQSESGRGDSYRDIADSFNTIAESFEGTTSGEKAVMNELIAIVQDKLDTSGADEKTTAMLSGVLEAIKQDELEFGAISAALQGIAEYADFATGVTDTLSEDVPEKIVNGLAQNAALLDALGDGPIVLIDEAHQEAFASAISASDADDAAKAQIAMLLGVTLK